MTSRDKVLKVYPNVWEHPESGTIWTSEAAGRSGDLAEYLGESWDSAASTLPPGSPAVNYLSGHDDPALTETCPICGASRKPGDKCASCGQQPSPAGETASSQATWIPGTFLPVAAVPEPVPTEGPKCICHEGPVSMVRPCPVHGVPAAPIAPAAEELIQELKKALRQLRNECSGWLGLEPLRLPQMLGYTNVAVMKERVMEADILLARAEEYRKGAKNAELQS